MLGGVLLLLVAVVGVGAVIAGGLGLGGMGGTEPAPTTPIATGEIVPGGVIQVGEMNGAAGTLKLTLRPPARAVVTITSAVGDFKKEWDGSGVIELVGLDSGTYRTKVTPKTGQSVRATLDVQPGKTCSYTFELGKSEEWQNTGCE